MGLVESERKAKAEMSGMLVRLSPVPKGPFGSSGFETGPAKSTSQLGKSAVFEIRTFDLAGQAPVLVPNRPKGLMGHTVRNNNSTLSSLSSFSSTPCSQSL